MLYPHQPEGIKHLLSNPFGRPHALLADSPGTGKTIMMIEAAKQANCKNGLIICPAIIKEQWRHKMIEWKLTANDDEDIQVVYGQNAEITKCPWIVINYDLIRVPAIKKQLGERKWHCLTMDEAHRLKSHNSQQSKAVFAATHGIGHSAYYKWAMSGTIVPNRPVELYPLLYTMAPKAIEPYTRWPDFLNRYCAGSALPGQGASNIAELTEKIQPFMLRRELKDVWKACPELLDNIVWLDVPFEDHPEFVGSNFLEPSTERRIVAEAKIPYTVAYIKDRLESGVDKIVVFSYHRKVIESFHSNLASYHPVKIYGGVSSNEREDRKQKFLTDPRCKLFLVQIGSGGEGLDRLQEVCNEVIEAEPEWSPGREDQAIARVLRLGQTKPVMVTRLLAARSYEERIYYANQEKRSVINVILKPNGGPIITMLEQHLERIASALEKHNALTEEQLRGAKTAASSKAQPAAPKSVAQVAPESPPVLPTAVPPVVSAGLPPITPSIFPKELAADKPVPFEDQVIALAKPLGKPGVDRIIQLNTHYKVEKLSEVPVEKRAEYLQYLAM